MADVETTSVKKTLIEHTDDLNSLMKLADSYSDSGEEVPQELMDEITNALTGQGEKVDRCVAWVNRARAEIEWLKEEKRALDAQIKRVESSIERMNTLAGYVMENTGESRLVGLRGHSFRWHKSSGVKVLDESLVPDEFKVTKTVLDKRKIMESLRSGHEISGVELEVKKGVVSK